MSAVYTTIVLDCEHCGGQFKWATYLDSFETVRFTVERLDDKCSSHRAMVVDRTYSGSPA